jgi:hypothetical protein
MATDRFEVLILNGRPAAGKSEIIDFLKKIPIEERLRRFHVGEFEEFDDFPILWERFEDDDLWQKHGRPRLTSETHFEYQGGRHEGYVFKDPFFWHWLLEKLNFAYAKRLRNNPDYHKTTTALFEFARGSQHGGWKEAYPHLSDDVLSRAATIYIRVSAEESLRKNRRRRNPNKPDSILEHSLEDLKMEYLYKGSDWDEFSSREKDHLAVRDHRVPFAIFENEPEKTLRPELLGPHLEEVCDRLWKLYRARTVGGKP